MNDKKRQRYNWVANSFWARLDWYSLWRADKELGGECQRPAVKKTGRCTRHGGKSTGPRTQAGRNKIAALHTTHGKYTKAKRREAQKSAEVGRKVRAEIKLIETCLIEQGVLDRNWRKDW